jgi:hypothetical protein
MRGFQGLLHDTGQVISGRVQVDRVFETRGEHRYGRVRVAPPAAGSVSVC